MTVADAVFTLIGSAIALMLVGAIAHNAEVYISGQGQTVSQWMLAAAQRSPLVPALAGLALGLIAGVLCGHWFWPQKG